MPGALIYEIPLIWLSIAREHESSHGSSGGSCAAGNGAASGRCGSHCLLPCAGVCVAGFAPSARHPLNFWCISKRHFNGMALALRVSVDMPVRSRLSPIANRPDCEPADGQISEAMREEAAQEDADRLPKLIIRHATRSGTSSNRTRRRVAPDPLRRGRRCARVDAEANPE